MTRIQIVSLSQTLVHFLYQLKYLAENKWQQHTAGWLSVLLGFVSSSGQGATDQGEGAQGSAAVRTHGRGALEAAGGAETERGAPQGCSGGEEEAAARGGEG